MPDPHRPYPYRPDRGSAPGGDAEESVRSTIGPELVEHIARLAAIELFPGDAAALARELQQIVAFVEVLREVDVAGAAPVPAEAPLRDDEPGATLGPELALREAPVRLGFEVAVPLAVHR